MGSGRIRKWKRSDVNGYGLQLAGLLASHATLCVPDEAVFQSWMENAKGGSFLGVADVGWITGHSYIVYGPLANGATTKRDASPRTTMMMESRDTQILSDLPPRCDVDDDDDDDDDASIVFVVVLSEEEDRRRRERPRDPLRSSNDTSKRDTIDRLSKTISSRRHIEEGPFLFFSRGGPPR